MLKSLKRRKKQEEEQLKQEFELINPMAEVPQGAIPDKDFEPGDPGWPYPDVDWGFREIPTVDNHTDIED